MKAVLPFIETFTLRLSDSERDVVARPIIGDGGHQRLLRECLHELRADTLTLDALTLAQVQRYAYDYGSGGYQERFRTLIYAARRAGWTA